MFLQTVENKDNVLHQERDEPCIWSEKAFTNEYHLMEDVITVININRINIYPIKVAKISKLQKSY